MSYTKGPLTVEVWDYPNATIPEKKLVVISPTNKIATFEWDEGQDNPYTIPDDEARGNAALFCAAPDLVEALEELAQYAELVVQDISDLDCAWYYQLKAKLELAQQVLTKAKGTTS